MIEIPPPWLPGDDWLRRLWMGRHEKAERIHAECVAALWAHVRDLAAAQGIDYFADRTRHRSIPTQRPFRPDLGALYLGLLVGPDYDEQLELLERDRWLARCELRLSRALHDAIPRPEPTLDELNRRFVRTHLALASRDELKRVYLELTSEEITHAEERERIGLAPLHREWQRQGEAFRARILAEIAAW